MKKYIGTKQLKAKPMNLGEYNVYRGWLQPSNEDQKAEGYLVEYLDGGKSNDERHEGYISWSPKDVFERAYKPCDTPLQRVEIEYDELMEKYDKLVGFLGREDAEVIVGERQLQLMELQRHSMHSYLVVLRERMGLMK